MNDTVENLIEKLKVTGERPSLLLHCCCAPCASAVLERLTPWFRVTAYFCNPNITEEDEYEKRYAELERLCERMNVPLLEDSYSPTLFFVKTAGLEQEPERGKRCKVCFALRLGSTAWLATEYDWFATTLTLSPLKDASVVNEVGEDMAGMVGANYLVSDFKKKDGYKRSIELSREYGLYRQDFCGCVWSKRERRDA